MPGYAEAALLRARLAELQRAHAGVVTEPLHLVCARLRGERLEHLGPALREVAGAVNPFELRGERLEPIYSSFHGRETLTCRLAPCAALLALAEALAEALAAPGLPGLELLQARPDARVTLLDDIRVERLRVLEYGQPLFRGERLVLAQQLAPRRLRALCSAPLGCASSSLAPSG